MSILLLKEIYALIMYHKPFGLLIEPQRIVVVKNIPNKNYEEWC